MNPRECVCVCVHVYSSTIADLHFWSFGASLLRATLPHRALDCTRHQQQTCDQSVSRCRNKLLKVLTVICTVEDHVGRIRKTKGWQVGEVYV